jgi:hypothetical protein
MPGMKLGFVQNATQRIATNRSMPTQHVEALLRYGAPAKRQAALKKVVLAAPSLAQHKETHQLLLALCEVSDNTKRCEVLYAMRGKVKDLSRNRYGNVVLQRLFERLPAQQRREVALDFVEEAADMARHPFANHVIQKLATFPESAEVLLEATLPHVAALAVHNVGQHVIAAFVQGAATPMVAALEPLMGSLLEMPESAVLTALLRAPQVPEEVQDNIRRSLLAKLPQLVEAGQQHFALVAAIETASLTELSQWTSKISEHINEMAKAKGMAAVVAALVRREVGAPRETLVKRAVEAFGSVVEAASHPYGSLIIREALCAGSVAIPARMLDELAAASDKLAVEAAGVVVLQRLLMLDNNAAAKATKALIPLATALMQHKSGCHALQTLLDHADSEVKKELCAAVLPHAQTLARDPQGTFVLQKAVSLATPEEVQATAATLAPEAAELAFDKHGCFAVAALLNVCKSLGLKDAWKPIMDALKPLVQKMATQPWTGQVVLDAMFLVASPELQAAMRDVIFMRCELFLSEPPEEGKRRPRSADSKRPAKQHRTE